MPDETRYPNGRERLARPGHWRRLAFIGLAAVLAAFVVEGGARLVYFAKEGWNPYYLRFGFVPDTEFHSDRQLGYSKFQPASTLHQKLGPRTIDIRINRQGFRGRDFTGDDHPAALRVATLGASSTFGYYVEDDETYPYQLERLLRAALPGRPVEVFNLGIPHLRSSHIVALARHELPRLRPHVITLYCGFNNANLPKGRETAGRVYRLKDWLYFHSVFWRSIHAQARALYYGFVERTGSDPVELPNMKVPLLLDQSQIERLRTELRSELEAHLEDLDALARELGAALVLITQNTNLVSRTGAEMEGVWRRYDEELAIIEKRLADRGELPAIQATLLIHHELMETLRSFATRRGLGLVDGIEALARDPSEMYSAVHLSPAGNRWIAEAIFAHLRDAGLLTPMPVPASE